MNAMTVSELLQWGNVLLIPVIGYLIRIETRLVKMETMQSAEYKLLISRTRATDAIVKEIQS